MKANNRIVSAMVPARAERRVREVRDAICDHVAPYEPYRAGVIGFSDEVSDWVSKQTGRRASSVVAWMRYLLMEGFLRPWSDDQPGDLPTLIGITPAGWQQWKRFDRAEVENRVGISFDAWLAYAPQENDGALDDIWR